MRDFIKFNDCLCHRSCFNICDCFLYKSLKLNTLPLYWLIGTFSDFLAFGYVKIVKIEFSIKGAQSSIKSAKNWSFL